MSKVQIFKKPLFGDLTAILDDEGNVWFIANEVGEKIGLVSTRSSVRNHVDEQDKKLLKDIVLDFSTCCEATASLNQSLRVINEAGFYDLVMRTDLRKARPFQKWVTHEVLPSIRKSGSYQMDPRPLTKTELLAAQGQFLVEQGQVLVDMERTQTDQGQRLERLENTIKQVTEGTPEGWGLVSRLATHFGMSKQKGKDLCAGYDLQTKKVSVGDYRSLSDMVEIDSFKFALGQELKSSELSENKQWFTGGRLGRFQAKGRLLDKYLKFKSECHDG
ncbi:BRO-N domain-containing protein [Vibrio splendidus]|uniref:BRO-N domain-containing protein n=1 Tax=Vibrio splendidus TaxID=29497 RepID=UPI000769F37D|nr:Bro-N domain-containing protein [Vibrio splendidus]PHX05471.1 hypothetical protein VSPL_28650 [Vibrio splendidus]